MADVAAIVLAAGRASRFGAADGESKVLADLAGLPLVRHVALRALASGASPVVVVTGNAAPQVGAALEDLPLSIVYNDAWAGGMASSLRAGIAALPTRTRGALVMLGDMPRVAASTLDRLAATFATHPEAHAILPVHRGHVGNPVLIGRAMFADLARLSGDEGARTLFGEPHRTILRCAVDDPGIAIDVDTREALAALRDDVASAPPTGP